MLERLLIKDIATYDSTGIEIDNFKKVNFIYGANGSGKTTLSNLLRDSSEAIFSGCNLTWRGGIQTAGLVYNKSFRDRNFGKGKMDGVFTLGEATKEQIEAIQKMQEELGELKTKGIDKKNALTKQEELKLQEENDFREIVWNDIYKEHESYFKEAFRGYLKKESFKDKLIDQNETNKEQLLSLETLKEKAKTIFGEAPTPLNTLLTLPYKKLPEIESNKIWKKKIIGKADVPIAALIQRLNLNDWVNEGRSYIGENDICPFCQQKTVNENFKQQLEEYFDEAFLKDIEVVKSLSEDYYQSTQNLINSLEQIESQQKAISNSKLDVDQFSALVKTLNSQFTSNRQVLENKGKEPSRIFELMPTVEQGEQIQKLISNANEGIKEHNILVNDFANQKASLINSAWKYLVDTHKTVIETFLKKQDGLERGISALRKQHQDLQAKYLELNKKIKEANKNVTSVQPSVDEINSLLKSFGFLNFEIVASTIEPNQYQILRGDGTIAESTLSEGEITFITFLYFLQLAKGSTKEENISEERVLIIDDPISSLDSTVLFVVSSLIKEIIKSIKSNTGNIKQLILLTHNVYFHKEVSFVDGRTQKSSDTYFWILRKSNNLTSIQCFEMENPIQNSYELLWKELSNSPRNSGITIQNIMRRIIENYFKILGKYADDDLIKSFEVSEEQDICRSLVSWINDGSHGIPDDLYIQQQGDIIDRYFQVFRQIFIKMNHEEHYNMMFKPVHE